MTAQKYGTLKHKLRDGLRGLGIDISKYRKRGTEKFPAVISQEFQDLYKTYHPYSMIKWQGLYSAFRAIEHIHTLGIKGEIVECGVWKGGCIAIMANHLKNKNDTDRKLYLYDTFEGMSEPTEEDYSFVTGQSATELAKIYQKNGWSVGALDSVEKLMAQTGYPPEQIHFIKGKVEGTIPKTIPDKIALLRLDTDWHASTLHELEHLYPRLVKGGILIIDDYGAWAGSRQAVDEYFAKPKHKPAPFFHYDSMSGNLIGVKP